MSKSDNQEERIDSGLKILGLEGIRASFKNVVTKVIKEKNITPYDLLENLLEKEMLWKEEKRIDRWKNQTKFPWIRTIESYDFEEHPELDKTEIYELASCRFIQKSQNILFFGGQGLGKTHLAIALGLKCIEHGYEVKYTNLGDLLKLIEGTTPGNNYNRLFNNYLRTDVLIIDEMDLQETSKTTSEFMWRLICKRYDLGKPLIITSTRGFGGWDRVFGSQERAASVADRLLEKVADFTLKGESYRLKKSKLNTSDKNNIVY